MRKIVLHNLSTDIQDLIADRANAEKLTHVEVVVEILHDAAITRAVQHDMEIIEAFEKETEDDVLDSEPFVGLHTALLVLVRGVYVLIHR